MNDYMPKKTQPRFLNQRDLADRWQVAEKSLERWRYEGKPPIFTKINGKVLYAMEDIEDLEQISRRQNTGDLPGDDELEGHSIPPAEAGDESQPGQHDGPMFQADRTPWVKI